MIESDSGTSQSFSVELNATEISLESLKLPVTIKGQTAFYNLPTEVEFKADIADCTVSAQLLADC